MMKNILIIGGAGYVGSALVPALLKKNYNVTVLDLFMYGEVLNDHDNLTKIKCDVRNYEKVKEAIDSNECVVHLACISNDPSFELDSNLGKSINYDSFVELIKILETNTSVKKFIYASSSSVYGIKNVKNVTEDMSLEPLTDYSIFKAKCEELLNSLSNKKIERIIIRPATVCGYAPRLRLDLVVNIMTNLGYHNNKIRVFGGKQLRPNVHVDDMVNAYIHMVEHKANFDGKVFNVGIDNLSLDEIASKVKSVLGDHIEIQHEETNDNRSYHISSKKFISETGFKFTYTVDDAVSSLKKAFKDGLVDDPLNNIDYFNIKKMQNISLK